MTAPLRTLIVDDERLARSQLRRLCENIPAVQLIGECAGGSDAIAAVKRERPDMLLLDVEMPGVNGFDVLARLPRDQMPAVIMVTAYDQYALRAFDVHAIDYILKPADPERLRAAVESARLRMESRNLESRRRQLASLVEEIRRRSRRSDSLAVPERDGILRIPLASIDWVQAEDNYVRVHTGMKSHLLRSTLGAIEKKLDSGDFARIHRSVIVNLEKIAKVRRVARSKFAVVLSSGAQLRVSRPYGKHVINALRNPSTTK
ncbi:MAG TPA: LytTR family DNA-binding domain-containing protein [Gemmatimonadaceae bacterium]|nr:LytTR family DNA-binding domain-containing protein [Gemmatimonadaceae bacterium]